MLNKILKSIYIGGAILLVVLLAVAGINALCKNVLDSEVEKNKALRENIRVKDLKELSEYAVPIVLDNLYGIEVNGHRYIIILHKNFSGLTHDESCECRAKQEVNSQEDVY